MFIKLLMWNDQQRVGRSLSIWALGLSVSLLCLPTSIPAKHLRGFRLRTRWILLKKVRWWIQLPWRPACSKCVNASSNAVERSGQFQHWRESFQQAWQSYWCCCCCCSSYCCTCIWCAKYTPQSVLEMIPCIFRMTGISLEKLSLVGLHLISITCFPNMPSKNIPLKNQLKIFPCKDNKISSPSWSLIEIQFNGSDIYGITNIVFERIMSIQFFK